LFYVIKTLKMIWNGIPWLPILLEILTLVENTTEFSADCCDEVQESFVGAQVSWHAIEGCAYMFAFAWKTVCDWCLLACFFILMNACKPICTCLFAHYKT
jgi:hypothetical protein